MLLRIKILVTLTNNETLYSMLDLYGNGKDLYELYMSKHGGDGGPGGTIKLK